MRHPACLIAALAPKRRYGRVSLAAALLLTAALAGLNAGTALAAKPRTPNPAANAPRPDDGLGLKDVYIEADVMTDDKATNIVTATGHVEVRYEGRSLRADTVVYNSQTGAVHATGHTVVVSADGSVEYADEATFDDQLRAGVAIGFSARLQDNVSIVAGAAIRRAETVNELHSARYTACDICNKDGSPKEPTFSIEAQQIIEDRDRQVVYYRKAIIRVMGIPVLYLPIFWHPDPSATRKSGFLTPKIEIGKRRGGSYEQPYLWAISPSADLRITPQLNTRVNPLLNLHYRERFFSGDLDIRAGYTDEQLFSNHAKFGNDTNRSYILARGAFDVDPKWTVGFGAERVTDPTFFQRYSVNRVFQDRGPYPTDTDRLISQLYAKRQDSQSFFSIGALSYESLRATLLAPGGTVPPAIQSLDNSATFPVAVPVEARFDPDAPILGGHVRVQATAVSLSRNNTVLDVTDPSGVLPPGPQAFNGRPTGSASLTYKDSRRVSSGVQWRTDFTLVNGLRVSPFVEGHGDAFSIDNGTLSTGLPATATTKAESFIGRASGTVGADLSWPFIRPIAAGSIILEPLAQIALSPKLHLNPNIPNEDSDSFEFDETTLFQIRRFPGYDLDEGGQRLNVGGRATIDWGGGHSASFLLGRVFRTEVNTAFTVPSGLQGTSSDWVTAATLTPIQGISVFNRARLDGDTWKVHREEFGVNASYGPITATLRYLYDEQGLVQVQCAATSCPSPFGGLVLNGATVTGKVQNAELGGTAYLTKTWGVTANITRDLQTNIWPVAQLGLFYQDDCVRLDLIYTHDETFAATIGTSNSIVLRLTLATLGGTLASTQKASDSR